MQAMTNPNPARFALLILCLCATFLCANSALAQGPVFDNTGHGLLHGTYYFREVYYLVGDNSGSLSEAAAVYGNISFDGNGNYSLSGAQVADSAVNGGIPQNLSVSGTYTIGAGGYGF